MKKLISIILILSISLLSLTACSTKTEEHQLTINDIIEQSDGCIRISTYGMRKITTQEGDTYITKVLPIKSNIKDIPVAHEAEVIKIVQKGENYIKKDESYIIFVNRSETDEKQFYITGGKRGVIKLEKYFNTDRDDYADKYKMKLKCLDENLQESTEEYFGKYENSFFSCWITQPSNYDLSVNESKNPSVPVTGFYENVITTAPETQN